MTTALDLREDRTVGVTPERSLQQRLDALVRANEVRTFRARTKADLKSGRTSPTAVILSDDPRFETWKVFDLLMSLPRIGRQKANRMMLRERISPSKTVGGLSERQRASLLELVR